MIVGNSWVDGNLCLVLVWDSGVGLMVCVWSEFGNCCGCLVLVFVLFYLEFVGILLGLIIYCDLELISFWMYVM